MANVNINSKVSDQFFRYKMPKLIAKVEGKGNGIKTVIVNMVEIAKALNRPPMYPTKYFGCQLGAQVNFDAKGERFIVNGAHEADKLQDLLDGFIKKYVLCQSCENPETILSVSKKKELIGTSCMACGYSGTIPSNDRLGAYILKNPPPKPTPVTAPTAAAGVGGTPTSANDSNKSSSKSTGKSGKSKSSKRNQDNSSSINNTNSSHDVTGTLNEADFSTNNDANDDEDEDWGEDTDADAVRRRMDELSAGAKCLMLNDDLEKKSAERLQIFYNFVEDKAKSLDLTLGENQKLLKSEAERLDLNDKAIVALCQVMFEEDIFKAIVKYKNLFLRFTNENLKAQRYLLRGLEQTILEKKELLPKVSTILGLLYKHDIIEEDAVMDWYKKGQKKPKSNERDVFDQAKTFIDWLKDASEESDDDEDDKVDIDFDDRAVGDAIKVEEEKKNSANATTATTAAAASNNASSSNSKTRASAASNSQPKPDEDDDDDLDIDAI